MLAEVSVHPDVAGYARLYEGRALLALERHGEAIAVADELIGAARSGYLREAALALKAEAAETAEEWSDAVAAQYSMSL